MTESISEWISHYMHKYINYVNQENRNSHFAFDLNFLKIYQILYCLKKKM